MSEVADVSVDLIITSPPYNIGTAYGSNNDTLSLAEYQATLEKVFAECARVLKTDGILVLECADSILSNGVYIQLAAYVQSLCLKQGLKVKERHFNFLNTQEGVELPENEKWNGDYQTTVNNHSNLHQLIVFSKDPSTVFNPEGKTLYVKYVAEQGHPCPIPEALRSFLLDRYFKTGMSVADPFMGTGMTGVDVVRRGGTFVGYELDPAMFAVARGNFEKLA